MSNPNGPTSKEFCIKHHLSGLHVNTAVDENGNNILKLVDPKDATGKWIFKKVTDMPGAYGWVENTDGKRL